MKIVLTPKTGKSQDDGQLVELEAYDKRPIPQSLVEYLAQKFPSAIGKVVFHQPANQKLDSESTIVKEIESWAKNSKIPQVSVAVSNGDKCYEIVEYKEIQIR